MTNTPSLSLETVVAEPLRFAFEVPFKLEALHREPLVSVTPARIDGEVSRSEGATFSLPASRGGELECSRCLAPYPFAHDEQFLLILRRRVPVAGEEISRSRRSRHVFLRRPGRARCAHRRGAHPDGGTDEAPLRRSLPRPLPPVRDGSQPVRLQLRDGIRRPALERSEALERRLGTDAEPKTPPQQSAPRQAPRARRAPAARAVGVPELPRGESAPPRLLPLRPLQGKTGNERLNRVLRVSEFSLPQRSESREPGTRPRVARPYNPRPVLPVGRMA